MKRKNFNQSIKYKIGIFIIAVISALIVDICFDFFVVEYTSSGFGEILKEISVCYELQDALTNEKAQFAYYIKNRDKKEELLKSCERTDEIVEKLPLDLSHMDNERYARVWSIKNSYPVYADKRQEIIDSDYDAKDFIEKVYDIYEMQDYLIGYGERLMDITLSENNEIYQKQEKFFKRLPFIIGIVLLPIIVWIIYMAIRLQALILAPINKMVEVSKNIVWKTLEECINTLSIVLILISTSSIFGYCLTTLHVPDMAASAITGFTSNPIILALLLNLILLILGCIMDMAPIILIATPILLPIANSIGIGPIQFGIMVILNCGIGLLTPPVGGVLFIGSAVAKLPMEKVVKATLPFYLCMIITLLLITFIPMISLGLPVLFGSL